MKAAEQVDPGFKILLMPDMTILRTPPPLAAGVAELAQSPSVFRLADGRLVISPFKAEDKSAGWWKSWIATMKSRYGIRVAFVPTFLNFENNAARFRADQLRLLHLGQTAARHRAPPSPPCDAQGARHGQDLDAARCAQDTRPNGHKVCDEAGNTENFRVTWDAAIASKAEWVQLVTWNDYSESTQIAPSVKGGWGWLDLTSVLPRACSSAAVTNRPSSGTRCTSRPGPTSSAPGPAPSGR